MVDDFGLVRAFSCIFWVFVLLIMTVIGLSGLCLFLWLRR